MLEKEHRSLKRGVWSTGHYRALIRKETCKIYSSIKSIYAYCIVRFSDLHGPLILEWFYSCHMKVWIQGFETYGIWWNKYQLVLRKGWPLLPFNKTQYTSIKLKAFCIDTCTSAPVRRVKGQNLEFKFSFPYSMHSASWIN